MNWNRRIPRKKPIRSFSEVFGLQPTKSCSENLEKPKEIVFLKPDAPVKTVVAEVPLVAKGVSFRILWARPSNRKKRVWEGDGLLTIENGVAILLDDDGKIIGTSASPAPNLLSPGSIFMFASKEIEIVESCETETIQTVEKKSNSKSLSQLYNNKKFKPNNTKSDSSSSSFIEPYKNQATTLILPSPPNEHQWKFNPDKRPVINVKVDSFLTSRLRPHQREGLIFLYECVMGFKQLSHTGAILADEMGLGKTLQTISLIWTLLKHGPYGVCMARSVLVVAPTTLCSTWNKEFLKWLGRERIQPYLIDNSNKPSGFLKNIHSVMIISYERLIKHIADLENFKFDLIVCDEAHRLKNSNVKVAQALQKLCCTKRVLLTGTPIQNDLQEFFVLSNIANPGIFGTYAEFKEQFEDPILQSQKPHCSNEIRSIGEQMANKLNFITSCFLLRRTQNVLENILPTKTEYVLCCKLTQIQKDMYSSVIKEWWENRNESNIPPLSIIIILKKICNHPLLLKANETNINNIINDDDDIDNNDYANLDNLNLFNTLSKISQEPSGKILILRTMLSNLVKNNNEKIVIVSCSTRVLDIIASECKSLEINSSRLDGSTPIPQRQRIVDNFNSNAHSKYAYSKVPYILLLSSRAGGVGLSLPAASRLILFDSDWNPAIDNQAMARIWRDGQKKPVHIYRFLMTGTIEEKIYQRQMFKTGLSDAILDSKLKNTLKLCDAELKDLFTLSCDSESTTHDMLKCSCAGNGLCEEIQDNEMKENENYGNLGGKTEENNFKSINQLKLWGHLRAPFDDAFLEETGLSEVNEQLSFIFRKVSEKNK